MPSKRVWRTPETPNYRQAKDISDEVFLDGLRRVCELRPGSMVTRWDLAMVLGGIEEPVAQCARADRREIPYTDVHGVYDVPGVPEKVVLAKAKRLIKRGLIHGCACGCRGGFEVRNV